MGPRRSRVARQGLPGAKVRGARTTLLRGMIWNAGDYCQSGWSSVEVSGAQNLRPPRVSEEGVGLVCRHMDADEGSILFDTCITENMRFVASSAVGGDAGQRVGEVVVNDLWKASAASEDVLMPPLSFCLSLSVCVSVRLWVRSQRPSQFALCLTHFTPPPHSASLFSLQNAPAAWMTMDE